MPNNEITLDVSGGGSADVTLETTPGTGTEIEMDTQGGGGSDGPYARKAEAWAVGKRNGVDVPSTDETYHNNSKYWAENASFLRAQLAVMVGNLEGLDQEWEDAKDKLVDELTGTVEDAQSEIQEDMDALRELRQRLIDDGLRKIAGPNLLKQNFWTSNNNETMLYGSASMWTGYNAMYLKGLRTNTKYTYDHEPTTEERAGASRIWQTTEDGQDVWYVYKDEDDITESLAALTGANIVTDLDGESYDKAIQFVITANSAYGNREVLFANYGNWGAGKVYTGESAVRYPTGNIEAMQVGHRYTVSCWVRIISGDGVMIKFGYGGTYQNTPYGGTGEESDYITVTGSGWQRVYWTFDFNPTGPQFTDSDQQSETVDGQTVTYVNRTANWTKRVLFEVCRKWNATVQMCGFRLHEGEMWAPDLSGLMADYESLHQRQLSLEAVQLNLFGAAGNEF